MPGHYRGTKIQNETQRVIPIAPATSDGVGTALCKTNILLGRMNNRLYRQCLDYDVSFQMSYNAPTSDIRYHFLTLPNTWFVKGAIKHAFNTYMQCMQDELAAGVRPARWHDFVINEQDPDGTYDIMQGYLFDGAAHGILAADETVDDSSVTNAAGTSQGFHIIGNLANSYNIFREFAKLLNYNQADDPTVSSDQPYDGLLDLDDADVLAERGDAPPYDRDFSQFIPADTTVDGDTDTHLLVHQATIMTDSHAGQGYLRTPIFTAPLGLVWIMRENSSGTDTDFPTSTPEISLVAAKGDYKGVRARSLVA